MKKALLLFSMVLLLGAILALGFIISAGLTWVVCWAFDFAFTWKIAIGVWVLTIILGRIFRGKGR